jgi:hypothetical protein
MVSCSQANLFKEKTELACMVSYYFIYCFYANAIHSRFLLLVLSTSMIYKLEAAFLRVAMAMLNTASVLL